MLHRSICLPEYVVQYALSMISQHALVVVLQTQAVSTKADMVQAAKNMGYSTIGPLMTALKSASADGFCNLHKYNVDWTPLFDKCFAIAIGSVPVVQNRPQKPKDERLHEMYVLAGDMRLAAPNYFQGSIDGWAKHVLPKLTAEFGRDDILGYCAYIESYYTTVPVKGPTDYRGIKPKDSNLPINIRKWIDGGRKEKYASPNAITGI